MGSIHQHRTLLLLLIGFVLFICVGGEARKCPRNCRCESRNLVYVSCAWLDFTAIPEDIPLDVEHLSLYANDIKTLKSGELKNFTRLEVLSLTRNGIESIEAGAFSGLKRLKSLSLSGNKIRRLPKEIFHNLSTLTELRLDYNEIDELPQDLLSSLRNLEELYINGNKLPMVPTKSFTRLSNLKKLGLSDNRIEEIRDFAFSGLDRLTSLQLSGNNITTVEPKAFYDLLKLTRLHLDNNKLRTLSSKTIRKNAKLSLFTLHNNSFLCNCDLRWLRGIFEQRKIIVPRLSDVTCHEPPFARGLPLFRLTFADISCPKQGWTTWGSWSICNTRCGGGLRYRERKCENAERTTFGCIGNKFQTESCNTQPCPYFRLKEWSAWGACSKSCGDGVSTRYRSCINFFTGVESKLCTEPRNERKSCRIKSCKIDGAWSQWSPWSPCSRTCGMAIKRRRRSCTDPLPQNGGAHCDGGFTQSQNRICIGPPCRSKIKWTSWSEFSPCSTTCGPGEQIRQRFCINELRETVEGCEGNSKDKVNCTSGPCPIDGGWASWSDWSRCHPILCKRARARNCSQPTPAHGGRYCQGSSTDQISCDASECLVYSQWGQWEPWTACTKSCGGGQRTRRRKCLWDDLDDLNDRDAVKVSRSRSSWQLRIKCGLRSIEQEDCNTVACTIGTRTVWTSWGRWSTCKGGCNGKQTRKRKCMYPSIEGVVQFCAGHSREEKSCISSSCQSYGNGTISEPCRGKGAPENGYEFIKKNGSTFTATYSCKKYYKLKGERKMTCTARKGWSHIAAPLCVPVCGKRSSSGFYRGRVFGGDEATRGTWPWQVLIVSDMFYEGGWRERCGGSLINDQWVVTAGHCLFEKTPNKSLLLIKPEGHKLYFGVHTKSTRNRDPLVQEIRVKKTIYHPKFNYSNLESDIGLMQLERKVQFTDYIRPVCLPNKSYKSIISTPGRQGHVIGWGNTETGFASNTLQELSLPIVKMSDCKRAHRGFTVSDSMFCAGRNELGIDTCKGDSGGGFLFWDKKRRKWTLQGIISWGGISCGQAGVYSVYAKVGAFSRWIKRVIRRESRL